MPDIDFAFLADAAETVPGQKFHVLGGGVARIGGRRFPLRHPHLALVIGLQVTAPETDREHEIRFVLLDPDGGEVAGATGSARWVAYFEPLPDRLRDDEPTALRATATRCRAAYGVKDSIRDALPADLTEPFLDSIDRLIRELNRPRG